ncbi:cytosolic class II aldolase [Chaetoceros tenuissimus]|uniref:fructose-bisphosphate aldolase n=1 Tax=Chaetoceros tenuissimus TaxID=426638 RepID=A0AAD3HFL0_9STRA|nr:cytosolic class II aldolase [Chaetoceros tenuissimus]
MIKSWLLINFMCIGECLLKFSVNPNNIDTDTQWAYWNGVRNFVAEKHDYLQRQIGNPEGEDVPNKKHYDPRVWIRKAEVSMIDRLCVSMTQLNSKDKYKRSQEPGAHQSLPFKKPVQAESSIETTA